MVSEGITGSVYERAAHVFELFKGLVASVWKDAKVKVAPGRYQCDDLVVVRVTGSYTKCGDEMVAPTVSIPLLPTLALFWEKCGVERHKALELLREAVTEAAIDEGPISERIKDRVEDLERTIKVIKTDLIARLPKVPRAGKLITKDLTITLTGPSKFVGPNGYLAKEVILP